MDIVILLLILWIKTLIVSFRHFLLNSFITSFWAFIIFSVQVLTILLNSALDFFEILSYSIIWWLTSVNFLLIVLLTILLIILLIIPLKPLLLRITLWDIILTLNLSSFIKLLCCVWHLLWLLFIIILFLLIIFINFLSISLLFFKIFFFPLILFLFPNIKRFSTCWLNCPYLINGKILQTFCYPWIHLKAILIDLLANQSKCITCLCFYFVSWTVWSCQPNVLNYFCYDTFK